MADSDPLAELMAGCPFLTDKEKLAIAMKALWFYSANIYSLSVVYLDRDLEFQTVQDDGKVAQAAWAKIVGASDVTAN